MEQGQEAAKAEQGGDEDRAMEPVSEAAKGEGVVLLVMVEGKPMVRVVVIEYSVPLGRSLVPHSQSQIGNRTLIRSH
jgi:hypothetical protein